MLKFYCCIYDFWLHWEGVKCIWLMWWDQPDVHQAESQMSLGRILRCTWSFHDGIWDIQLVKTYKITNCEYPLRSCFWLIRLQLVGWKKNRLPFTVCKVGFLMSLTWILRRAKRKKNKLLLINSKGLLTVCYVWAAHIKMDSHDSPLCPISLYLYRYIKIMIINMCNVLIRFLDLFAWKI